MNAFNKFFAPDGINAMLVDEDKNSCSRLKLAFETMKVNIEIFNEASSAFKAYKARIPKILLLGANCGTLTGLQFAEFIKKIFSNQIIIIMFEDNEQSILASAVNIGIDYFLQKPVKVTTLRAIIGGIIGEVNKHEELQTQRLLHDEYKQVIDKAFIVSVVGVNGEIIYANEKYCEVIGYSEDELIGKKHSFSNELLDSVGIFKKAKDSKVWRGRVLDYKKTGEEIILDVVVAAIFKENGDIKEYITFMQDVTEFVRVGRELKKREQQLRMRDITMARKHEQEMAKAKDAFLVIFTHELKTPLNSIINFSEHISSQLKRENFKKKDRLIQEARIIKESGREMLESINNLLDASKMKDGNLAASITTVYLGDLLDTLEVYFKDAIEVNNSKVLMKYKNNCKIETDYEKINKILQNLLSNAIKYSNGSIIISVICKGKIFEIIIEDNGNGIKDTSRVFELFEQGENDAMKRETKGVGVGLYVVGMMCELLHIDIELSRSKRLGGLCVRLSGKKIFYEEG